MYIQKLLLWLSCGEGGNLDLPVFTIHPPKKISDCQQSLTRFYALTFCFFSMRLTAAHTSCYSILTYFHVINGINNMSELYFPYWMTNCWITKVEGVVNDCTIYFKMVGYEPPIQEADPHIPKLWLKNEELENFSLFSLFLSLLFWFVWFAPVTVI